MFTALLRPQDHLQQTNTLFGKVENLAAPTSYLFRSHWHGWLCLKVLCHHGRFDVTMDDLLIMFDGLMSPWTIWSPQSASLAKGLELIMGFTTPTCWESNSGELLSSKMSSKWAVEWACSCLSSNFDGFWWIASGSLKMFEEYSWVVVQIENIPNSSFFLWFLCYSLMKTELCRQLANLAIWVP